MPNPNFIVLSNYTHSTCNWMMYLGICFVGFALIATAIVITCTVTSKDALILGLIATFCFIASGFFIENGKEETEMYKVIFNEEVNMNEFLRDYQIVKIDGSIVHIKER